MRFFAITLLLLASATTLAAGGSSEASERSDPPARASIDGESADAPLINDTIREHLSSFGIRTFDARIEAVDFSVPTLDGGTLTLADLEGSFVFLNFWATWCGPCREEMPSMEALQAALGDLPVVIVAANVQESESAARAFIEEFGYTFPVVLDQSGRLAQAYGVRGLPTSYFISPDGLVLGGLIGTRFWDEPEVVAAMTAIGEAVAQ